MTMQPQAPCLMAHKSVLARPKTAAVLPGLAAEAGKLTLKVHQLTQIPNQFETGALRQRSWRSTA